MMALNETEQKHLNTLFQPLVNTQFELSLQAELLKDAMRYDEVTFLKCLDIVNALNEDYALIHSLKMINNLYHNAEISYIGGNTNAIDYFFSEINTTDIISQPEYHTTVKQHIAEFTNKTISDASSSRFDFMSKTALLSIDSYKEAKVTDTGNALWRYNDNSLLDKHIEKNWCAQQVIAVNTTLSEHADNYFTRSDANDYSLIVKGQYEEPLPFLWAAVLCYVLLGKLTQAKQLIHQRKQLTQGTPPDAFYKFNINNDASILYKLASTPEGLDILKNWFNANIHLKKGITAKILCARTCPSNELDANTSTLYQLAKQPAGLTLLTSLLINNNDLIAGVTVDDLRAQCLNGPHTNASVLFWLAERPIGQNILMLLFNVNPGLSKRITADSLCARICSPHATAGPYTNTSALYWLAEYRTGQNILAYLLKVNPDLKKEIAAHDLCANTFSSLSTRPYANISVLSSLSASAVGRVILKSMFTEKQKHHTPTSPILFSSLNQTSLFGFFVRRDHLAYTEPLTQDKYDAASDDIRKRAHHEIVGAINMTLAKYNKIWNPQDNTVSDSPTETSRTSYQTLKNIRSNVIYASLEASIEALKDFFINEPTGKWYASHSDTPSIKPMLMKYLLTIPLLGRDIDNNTLTLVTTELGGLLYKIDLTKDYFGESNIKGLTCFFENEYKRAAGLGKPNKVENSDDTDNSAPQEYAMMK